MFTSPISCVGEATPAGVTPVLLMEGEYVSKDVMPDDMLLRESAGNPVNAVVVFDPDPLGNALFVALRTRALSFAGDIAIELKLNPAVV
jgi:hypothetical protein